MCVFELYWFSLERRIEMSFKLFDKSQIYCQGKYLRCCKAAAPSIITRKSWKMSDTTRNLYKIDGYVTLTVDFLIF